MQALVVGRGMSLSNSIYAISFAIMAFDNEHCMFVIENSFKNRDPICYILIF